MRYLVLSFLVLLSGCLCCCYQPEPKVHSVTFYGNESTTTIETPRERDNFEIVVSTSTSMDTLRRPVSHATTSTTQPGVATSKSSAEVKPSSSTSALDEDVHVPLMPDLLSATTSAGMVCVDSDGAEGLINTDIKGWVDFEGIQYYDYCVGDRIYEYYCDDGFIKVIDIICGGGCSGGACGGDSLASTTTK
ncbi:MAG: hypothetical protein GF416_06090 [Candidatus Altiarchaeales archaeon]|nr:hypothetical protein [Candidatus Altiarchaeales archaeon]MBD3416686.1 hypothetical protein [Candidatus Altiarchaeales archaeon]